MQNINSKLYVGILVPISIIVPISLSIFKFRKFPKELKIITYYLFFNAFSNFITSSLSNNGISTMPFAHLYTIVEFGFICYFYKELYFSDNNIVSRAIPAIFFAFLAICILNVLFLQDLHHFNSYTKPIEGIIVVGFAIRYLLQLVNDFDKKINKNIELIYINSVFLLYFSGTFVLFTIFNIFFTHRQIAFAILDVHATLLLLMYVLFTIALWKFKR